MTARTSRFFHIIVNISTEGALHCAFPVTGALNKCKVWGLSNEKLIYQPFNHFPRWRWIIVLVKTNHRQLYSKKIPQLLRLIRGQFEGSRTTVPFSPFNKSSKRLLSCRKVTKTFQFVRR